MSVLVQYFFFFFKQKTAYEMVSDWSSDVCSSDLPWATPGSRRRRGSGFAWRGKIAARQAAPDPLDEPRDRHASRRHDQRHERHVAPRAGQQEAAEHRYTDN